MSNYDHANRIIKELKGSIQEPRKSGYQKLYTGVDLGTAVVALTVVDEAGEPVCGAYEFADVVKDGMLVDYAGAIDIVARLKSEIENKISRELLYASVALPPGTESLDGGAVKNVAEAASFEVLKVLDEPSAANALLKIDKGAIVDIGGGTTGISIVKDGKVISTSDEATGGRHFSLVLAGAKNIPYEDAELIKRDYSRHKEIFPIIRPVIDKVISIIEESISGYDVDELFLVGGTASLTGIDSYIEEKMSIKTTRPKEPMFVTPLGLAIDLAKKDDVNGY